jgi:hypothetical protein
MKVTFNKSIFYKVFDSETPSYFVSTLQIFISKIIPKQPKAIKKYRKSPIVAAKPPIKQKKK